MKKLIFILLAIFNQNIFCAQVQEEVKHSAEQEEQSLWQKIDDLINLAQYFNKNDHKSNQISAVIKEIKALYLKTKIDINSKHKLINMSTLMRIARYSSLNELAIWMIDNGADIHKADNSETPLSSAVYGQNLDLVQCLINKGANVNNKVGNSTLYIALFQMFQTQIMSYGVLSAKDKPILKQMLRILLINGAKFKDDDKFQKAFETKVAKAKHYHSQHKEKNVCKRIFNKVLNDIATEYAEKIRIYNVTARKWLHGALAASINQCLIPEYTNEQIIDNIIDIRKTLGELDKNSNKVIANMPPGGLAFENEPQIAQAAAAQQAAAK